MKAWTHLGVALCLVTGTVACGLDVAGDLSFDAGGLSADVSSVDAHKVTPHHDAAHGGDATLGDGGEAGPGGDGGKDTGTPVVDGSVEASIDAASDVHADVTLPIDAGPHDAGHDGGHDADEPLDAGHDASPPVDASSTEGGGSVPIDAAGITVTGPPSGCFVTYKCGTATCNCDETCDVAANACGGCTANRETCGIIACGTDLTSILDCGGCGIICTCGITDYPVCTSSGGSYACGCKPL